MSIGNKRYSSTFYSHNNIKWEIDIYDSDLGSPGSGDFSVDDQGFNLSYNGDQDDTLCPIVGSELRFSGIIGEDANFYVMILQMMADHEERFSVKVLREDKLYWCGWSYTDLFVEEDTVGKYPIDLSATDGLAHLKNIDYDNAGTLYTGDDRIIDHLIKILTKTGLTEYWGANDTFMCTCVNWYEDSMHAPGETFDPLYLTKINHEAFQSVDQYGVTKPMKSYDVLQTILRQFNSRIVLSNGVWYVLPIAGYGEATFPYIYKWKKDGTYITGLASYDATETSFTRVAGGRFSYLPGLLKAKTTYSFKQGLTSGSLLPIPYVYGEIESLGTIQGGGDEKLEFSGDLIVDFKWGESPCPHPRIDVVYKIILSVSTYYYDTTSGFTQWVEDASKFYEVKVRLQFTDDVPGYSDWVQETAHIGFRTTSIPESGAGSFQFIVDHYEDWNGNTIDISDHTFTHNTTCENFRLNQWVDSNILQEGLKLFESTSKESDDTTDVGSKNIKDLGVTILGDGPNSYSSGRLVIYNDGAAAWENSDKWSLNKSGTTYDINQLRCREALAAQRISTWRYDGEFFETNPIYAHTCLVFCGVNTTNYMLARATQTASEDTWRGVWIRLL